MLCFPLYLKAITKYKPPRGPYIWRGDLTEVFCVTSLGGLYLEGLIFGILRYEKITVINNMQLLHYIDTVAICTGPIHRRVFAMTYGIKSLLEIDMKFLSLLKFLINKFP